MELLDTFLHEFLAKVELHGECCGLKHSEKFPRQEYIATNYLCQQYGVDGICDGIISIPVCDECVEALYDENWILFYCVNCNESQWLLRSKAKKEYSKDKNVYFFKKCPHCFKE